MKYDTILIPLDGSELCHFAVDAALPLARAFGSRVVLLSALDFNAGLFNIYYESYSPEDLTREIRRHLEAVLDRARDRLAQGGVKADTMLREGDPAEVIVDTARRENADLIVMTSHGRKGARKLFLGSVTDAVLREGPCPVLVVRPE
ncbi:MULTISPECIES: universal stress protein [Deferrisoma]